MPASGGGRYRAFPASRRRLRAGRAGNPTLVTMEPTPTDLPGVLASAYTGQERLTRDEIRRRAVAADVSAEELTRVDALPEGEYAEDEALEALRDVDRLHETDL